MGRTTRFFGPLLVAVSTGIVSIGAAAQEGPPAYQNLRFNEDWRSTPEDGYGDFFDPIKNIRLSDSSTLSVGGQIRLRHEVWSNFGFNHANDDTFLAWRSFLHTDWRFGDHLRLFVEGKTANLTERELPGGRRAALDEDELDLWNTFLQLDYSPGEYTVMVRAGRQEMQYGRQRLISPLDWASNRRIFDGVRFTLARPSKKWSLDGFWTIPVQLRRHKFNQTNDIRNFSGLYYKAKPHAKLGIEGYFFYLDDDNRETAVDSDLYTVGGRFWGDIAHGLSFDLETAYQFGNRNNTGIDAWMVATELTYRPKEVRLAPWVAVGFDYASGDDDPADHNTGTFNQLFPLGHAFNGYIDVVGRQNIVDAHGTVGFWPVAKKVSFKTDIHFFWLADEDDALYNAGGGVVRRGGVDETSVGTELDLTLAYKIDRHASFTVGYSHFFPGAFIRETGSENGINFLYTQMKYTF